MYILNKSVCMRLLKIAPIAVKLWKLNPAGLSVSMGEKSLKYLKVASHSSAVGEGFSESPWVNQFSSMVGHSLSMILMSLEVLSFN